MSGEAPLAELPPAAYAQALANILEDFAAERVWQDASQKALLNILDDAGAEKERLKDTQRAILNIADRRRGGAAAPARVAEGRAQHSG
jgi:hypothetical protein